MRKATNLQDKFGEVTDAHVRFGFGLELQRDFGSQVKVVVRAVVVVPTPRRAALRTQLFAIRRVEVWELASG